MAKKKPLEKLSGADARYGWKYGCEGFITAREAARRLGLSATWICELLKDEGRKKQGHPGYPLRAGRPEHIDNHPWRVCVRSVVEFAKSREPLEV